MLDLFAVLSTGGIILWSYSPYKHDYGAVIVEIMRVAIIEATCTENSILIGALEVKWTVHHDLGLLFLVMPELILPDFD
jgi:hypothetical protein